MLDGCAIHEIVLDDSGNPVDYRFLAVNPAFEHMTGLKAENLIGRTVKEALPGIEDSWIEKYGHVALTGEPMHFEDYTRELDRTYEVTAYRPAPYQFAVISVDISVRKQAENLLLERTRELMRSNAELEQFANIASHDLQEPLRMVASFTQLLERRYKGQLDQNADEYIHFITEGAVRMQRLIQDLLSLSRVGTHTRPFTQVPLESVLHDVLGNLHVAIQEHSAEITCHALPVVAGDPTQLAQVFQNLIANALKFHSDQPPRIYISASRQGEEWVISVRDNGIGIAPQYFDRIFIIFQRLHNREQYSGTGIGLAICKKIVERHGGRIWVDSIVGQGATFSFTIPVLGA
jgi:PAS domain S-box-containing protein